MKHYKKKPVVCSGTTIGTREGMLHYLTVLVDEFIALADRGENCIPPQATDQSIHTMLFYQGKFGPKAKGVPYGEGTVLTVGTPCTDKNGGHSLLDVIKRDDEGFMLLEDGTRPGMIHQYNRCNDWIIGWYYTWCKKLHGEWPDPPEGLTPEQAHDRRCKD